MDDRADLLSTLTPRAVSTFSCTDTLHCFLRHIGLCSKINLSLNCNMITSKI